MGTGSYCLVRPPTFFSKQETTEVTTNNNRLTEEGNLTYVDDWYVQVTDGSWELLYLTQHNEDVWPSWTNDFQIENLKAPHGEQQQYLYQWSDAFQTYMACGNNGNEGESGLTENSILIIEHIEGYTDGGLKDLSLDSLTIYPDLEYTFILDDNYPLGSGCKINFIWNEVDFTPSYVELDGVKCSSSESIALSSTTKELDCYLTKDLTAGAELTLNFKYTLVVLDVVNDGTNNG